MVEVPCDDFVFIAVGLFLDGVVEDQRTVVRFDGADGRLDQRLAAAGGSVGQQETVGPQEAVGGRGLPPTGWRV